MCDDFENDVQDFHSHKFMPTNLFALSTDNVNVHLFPTFLGHVYILGVKAIV